MLSVNNLSAGYHTYRLFMAPGRTDIDIPIGRFGAGRYMNQLRGSTP